MEALILVVWPTEEVEAPSIAVAAEGGLRRGRSDEQRLRALELIDAGYSQAKAGQEAGVARTTVQLWVRKWRVAA